MELREADEVGETEPEEKEPEGGLKMKICFIILVKEMNILRILILKKCIKKNLN